MSLPSWATLHNIRFDGSLQTAVNCGNIGDEKLLILWDSLPLADRNTFENIISEYGGQIPLPSPVSAFQVIEFTSSLNPGTSTGLESKRSYKLKIENGDNEEERRMFGEEIPTFGDLIDMINDVANTSAIIDGNTIKISSTDEGSASYIRIKDNSIIRALANLKKIHAPRPGVDSVIDILSKVKTPSGAYLYDVLPTRLVGNRPNSSSNVPKTTAYTYFGGNPSTWRYLADDTPISESGEGGGTGPTDIEVSGTNINFLG